MISSIPAQAWTFPHNEGRSEGFSRERAYDESGAWSIGEGKAKINEIRSKFSFMKWFSRITCCSFPARWGTAFFLPTTSPQRKEGFWLSWGNGGRFQWGGKIWAWLWIGGEGNRHVWIASSAAVPNLFGTGDQLRGRPFLHRLEGGGDGFGMIQAHYIYCALHFYYYIVIYNDYIIYNEIIIQLTIMLTGGGAQAVMWGMGSRCKYRWSFARSPATHLLLCSPVPNRPRTDSGLWPGVGDPWSSVQIRTCFFLWGSLVLHPFYKWRNWGSEWWSSLPCSRSRCSDYGTILFLPHSTMG